MVIQKPLEHSYKMTYTGSLINVMTEYMAAEKTLVVEVRTMVRVFVV